MEKEKLLTELQLLHESSNSKIAQLLEEKKQQMDGAISGKLEEIARRENERMDALESERKELARLHQEDTERQVDHKETLEEFRSENNRLHGELGTAGSVYSLLKMSTNQK